MGKANETLFVSNQSFNAITFFKKFEGKVGAQQAICSGNENCFHLVFELNSRFIILPNRYMRIFKGMMCIRI